MIKDDLKAVFDLLNSVPQLKWIDEDYGQIDSYNDKPAVSMPCALVSLNQQAEHLGGDEYNRANSITIRVAHSRLGDRAAKAAQAAFMATLAKSETDDAVISTMIDAGYYYRGFTTERRADGISCRALTFDRTN